MTATEPGQRVGSIRYYDDFGAVSIPDMGDRRSHFSVSRASLSCEKSRSLQHVTALYSAVELLKWDQAGEVLSQVFYIGRR